MNAHQLSLSEFYPKRKEAKSYSVPVSGLSTGAVRNSEIGRSEIVPFVQTARERVFQAILNSGEMGKTDREIQRELSMKENTERPRRVELWKEGRIRYKRDSTGQLEFRIHGVRVKEFVWVVGHEMVCPTCGSVPTKTYIPEIKNG